MHKLLLYFCWDCVVEFGISLDTHRHTCQIRMKGIAVENQTGSLTQGFYFRSRKLQWTITGKLQVGIVVSGGQ